MKRGPFTLDEARRAGIDRWHLRSACWKRVGPAVYVWAGLPQTPIQALAAAARRLPPEAAFSGFTALWLHGVDVAPSDPIEVTIPKHVGVSARAGLKVRRASIAAVELANVRGMRATTLVRTVADLCGHLRLTEAVVIADMALHTRRVDLAELTAWAERHPGRAGNAKLKRVIDLAEPAAESPMESRLRMLLVLGGLPRPRVQASIHDHFGRFAGRPDLYYEAQRLGIEYDGGVHRDRLAEDNRRQNRLLSAGVRLLRFTAGDVLNNPDSVVAQVRAEIHAGAGSGTSGIT